MRAIRGRDNKPELVLRKALSAHPYRYRLHVKSLVGKPDLVFRKARLVVFVDGDFWHGRVLLDKGQSGLKRQFQGPRANWWVRKIEYNVAKDDRITRTLRSQGWTVIRVWGTDVLSETPRVTKKIVRTLLRQLGSPEK